MFSKLEILQEQLNNLSLLVGKYSARIIELEQENAKLRKQLETKEEETYYHTPNVLKFLRSALKHAESSFPMNHSDLQRSLTDVSCAISYMDPLHSDTGVVAAVYLNKMVETSEYLVQLKKAVALVTKRTKGKTDGAA